MNVITLFTDHPFALAPLVGLLAAVMGSAVNLALTWDEWLCDLIAAEIGVFAVAGIAAGIASAAHTPELVGWWLLIFTAGALVGMPLSRALDAADHVLADVFSLIFKWAQAPVLTSVGLLITIGFAIAGKASFRRGCFFLNVGGENLGALTLGAVVYARGGCFDADGRVKDDLSQHEAYHSRQAAAFGEIGFYVAYLLVGMPWGAAQGGSPMSTNHEGCGNPFEKTARTKNHPERPKPAHRC
jgi:hypothetical protein